MKIIQKNLARAGVATLAGAMFLGSALLANAQTTTQSSIGGSGTTTSTTGTTGTTGTYTGTTGTTGVTNTTGAATTGTTGTTTGAGTTGTPGAPNTGAGGDAAANLALLTASGVAVLGAAVYLARRERISRA